jgi:hypothetical protein
MKLTYTSLTLVGLLVTQIARAATITVTSAADSGPGSLRAALALAADGDTINFATGFPAQMTLTSGELLLNKSLAVVGPGPGSLAISGNDFSRVFHITPGKGALISGLTITHGHVAGFSPAENGGGILNEGSTLTVSNCVVTGNSSGGFEGCCGEGGGIFNNGAGGHATLNVINSTLSGNSAFISGGGIMNDGGSDGIASVTIIGSFLNHNSAGGLFSDDSGSTDNEQGTGGGVLSTSSAGGHASVTILNSTLSGNSAHQGRGGGVFNANTTLYIGNSVLIGNSSGNGAGLYTAGASTANLAGSLIISNLAEGLGGGIDNEADAPSRASLVISASTLSGNVGGGLLNGVSLGGIADVQIADSLIANNSGSGLVNEADAGVAGMTLVHCTITGNSAYQVGGIENFSGGGVATLTLSNCSVAGNSAVSAGGGIGNIGLDGDASVRVISSTVSGNLAATAPRTGLAGGGLLNFGVRGHAALEVLNSTVSGNVALHGAAGGILNDSFSGLGANLVVLNSTLSGNSASEGANSLQNVANGGAATVQLGSSIISAAAPGSNILNVAGTVLSLGFNLSSDDAAGLLNQPSDQLNTDPLLGPLQDNGGPTLTHALLCGSPALDAGKNFAASANDQRGTGFVRTFGNSVVSNAPGGDGTDIGSFEAQTSCAHEDLERLIALVNDRVARPQPLRASLDAALAAMDRGNFNSAISQLRAFQNKVQAQVAPSDPALARTLIQAAQQIISAFQQGRSQAEVACVPLLRVQNPPDAFPSGS